MSNHKDLFFICENCRHPIIMNQEMEIGILPRVHVIQCHRCKHEHTDLHELKEYAKKSRDYARN